MSNRHLTRRRPLGPWDLTPAGIRAALISYPILLMVFLVNGAGAGVFFSTGLTAAMVCYPLQLLAYMWNGYLAGVLARATYDKATRMVGREHETVRRRHPNYVGQGALAGVILGGLAVITYILLGAAAVSLVPALSMFITVGLPPLVIFSIVDFTVCIGCGVVGGMIYRYLH